MTHFFKSIVLLVLLALSLSPRAESVVQTVRLKVTAPELAGEVDAGLGDDPASGATVQLCDKHWKACTNIISADAHGRFAFTRQQTKRVNHLLIKWPGANWVEAEVTIDAKAKPLVVHLHLE
jgi:hypothetical protein